MKRIVITVLLAVMSLPAVAAPREKVDICHFDMDYGVWKLISISGNAIDGHFGNHDDGFPGDTTLGTLTDLDGDCAHLACHCWDSYTLQGLAELMNGLLIGPAPQCSITEQVVSFHITDDGQEAVFGIYARAQFGGQDRCTISVPFAPELDIYGLPPEMATVCHAEAMALAASIDWCPH